MTPTNLNEPLGPIIVRQIPDATGSVGFTASVPTGRSMILTSLTFTLDCDGTVAQRFALLGFAQHGVIFHRVHPPGVQTANETITWNYSLGSGQAADFSPQLGIQLPLPDRLLLIQDMGIILSIVNGVVGDTITNIRLTAVEYPYIAG